MEEKYIQFINYPWNTSQEWRMYFNNLSDIPSTRELVMHFRKRFYKLKVDPEYDVKYDPNAPKENENKNQKPEKPKGLIDTLFASIEGFIWVAYFFNILIQNNVLKICLVSTILRFLRNKYKSETGIKSLLPSFNKEYLKTILSDEYFQLLIYIHILIICNEKVSYLLLFPISITAVYCICDYFANYLRVFVFFRKYFESVINRKSEIFSILGFSFVLIGLYLIVIGLTLKWNSYPFIAMYLFYIYFAYYFNENVRKTFSKIRNSLEYVSESNKTPDLVKILIKKFLNLK
jgi:hypothetical protein